MSEQYPSYLESQGEGPWFTEFFVVVNAVSEEYGGMGMFEYLLRQELEAYPTHYTTMPKHVEEIVHRMNVRYGYREIGAETESMFAANLQRVIVEETPAFEIMFEFYEDENLKSNEISMVSNGSTTFQDTPNGSLTDKYATNITDVENVSRTTEGTALESANRNMDRWRDLVNRYVDKFERCFMTTVGVM